MSVGEHWRPFLGEHSRSLDAKGRVILPARFREKLEGGGVMVSAIDGCLSVYTMDAFETFAAKVAATREQGPEQRDAARAIFAGSTDFVPDRQGRIAIPPKAKAHAGLEDILLIKQSRLSTMPLSKKHFDLLCRLGGVRP